MAIATFGAGCFWGVEATFRGLDGVTATAVGYAGGQLARPTYAQVCAGTTGHAEVVRVEYDSERISYDTLLEAFWAGHDPTQVDRQGADVGRQYRSVIFTHDDSQAAAAAASKAALDGAGTLARPVATAIAPMGDFWLAEDTHQQYLEKRGIRHG